MCASVPIFCDYDFSSEVRTHSYDLYLISLFYKVQVRESIWVLLAFNHEISKTRDVVTETQLGLIRLQWWCQEIEKIYDGQCPDANPILKALKSIIQTYDLKKDDFEKLIYAREFDLEDVCPADTKGLVNYADYTTTPLFKMICRITDGQEPDNTHIYATIYRLNNIIIDIPDYDARKRCLLPSDLINEFDLQCGKLEELEELPKAVSKLFYDLEKNTDSPSQKSKSSFLKLVNALNAIYKKRLIQNDFNPYTLKLRHKPSFLALRLWLSSFL